MDLLTAITKESITDEDVNILIGVNGSGKSTYLNEVSKHFLNRSKNVIAIANTIFDKFDSRDKNLKILRHSRGKGTIKHTIKEVFRIFEKKDEKAFFGINSVFEYVGFQSSFSIRMVGLQPHFAENLRKNEHLFDREELEIAHNFLNMYIEEAHYRRDVFTFEFSHDFYGLRNLDFLKFLSLEYKLRKARVLYRIDFFFTKKGQQIPVTKASSGELALLSTMMFINSHIEENSVILIDEPENSLHPQWQVEYVKRIVDVFYFYQPKIVIATHSPLIINGAELSLNRVKIFKANLWGLFLPYEKKLKNVEQIYEEYFNVTTPENRFLSDLVVDKMNLLYGNQISLEDFARIINNQITQSFDDRQKRALEEIIKLAQNSHG